MSELLSGEVAIRLRVNPVTVRRWVEAGRLKSRLNRHGWRVFEEVDVKRLEDERQKPKRNQNP